jgi:hypothetical protein
MSRETEDRDRRPSGRSPYDHETIESLTPSCQFVLACLREQDGEQSLIRLAREVATRYYGPHPQPVHVQRVYKDLYRSQLQQLVNADIVQYSSQDGTVTLAE